MAKWIKYILFLVIGLLLLFFAFKNTNLNDLIEEAKKVDLLFMVDSFFLDCEIKNNINPKIITNPKIDKE